MSTQMTTKNENHLSASGAEKLARRIENFWFRQGYAISCRTEEVVRRERVICHAVRSNLIAGLPANHKDNSELNNGL